MPDIISAYQRWKQQGERLRTQAKSAMEAKFRRLLSEAVQLAEEYRRDFGGTLKPATPVTVFRYKTSAKPRAMKASKQKPTAKAPEPSQDPIQVTRDGRILTPAANRRTANNRVILAPVDRNGLRAGSVVHGRAAMMRPRLGTI